MCNEQYFPLEVNMINRNNVSELIEAHGAKGFGAYVMLLTGLRNNSGYRCNLSAMKGLARRGKISLKLLMQVLRDFQLFDISREDETETFSSPYMDRVMSAYDEKRRKLSEAAKKRCDKYSRNEEGRFTDTIGAYREEKIREEKKKNTTAVVQKESSLPEERQQELQAEVAAVAVEKVRTPVAGAVKTCNRQSSVAGNFSRRGRIPGGGLNVRWFGLCRGSPHSGSGFNGISIRVKWYKHSGQMV